MAGIRVPPLHQCQPVPGHHGPRLPAPCQDGCNRNQVEDFVGINAVEQFIGDTALSNNYTFDYTKPVKRRARKSPSSAAVPAGLAAAYQLRRMGPWRPPSSDDHKELGGLMRYGIPGYRTPRQVLDGEINRILALGVEVRVNTRRRVATSASNSWKKTMTHCSGRSAHMSAVRCRYPGADAENCISGVAFLSAFNDGRLKGVSGKVICVGGGAHLHRCHLRGPSSGHIDKINPQDRPEMIVRGYTAQDVVDTAKREGADVTLTSLFPIDKMTAAQHEVHDALHEGVKILDNVMPTEVSRMPPAAPSH